jgi:protease-4
MSDNEMPQGQDEGNMKWERELINRLSFASLAEQRRARRWSIFFKLLLFTYLFLLLIFTLRGSDFGDARKGGEHTAMIGVNGMISDATAANADTIIEGLRNAFDNENTRGVVLRINSPGGSPVQSDYVYREIQRLRALHPDIPVHAVIVDVGASGAYYIASAADNIYVNPSSIVGSIGVLMNGFGFVGAMEKLGVERRLLTAGENKGMLDPFEPLRQEDVTHIKQLLGAIHQQFIDAVKQGRGDRLTENSELFSGKFWTGVEGIELGLVDEIGDVDYVAREVIGAEEVVDFTPRPDLFKRFADRLGASMANALSERVGFGSGVIR